MSLEKLLEKLQSDGRDEAEALREQGRAEVEAIGAEGRTRASEGREKEIQVAVQEAAREHTRIISNARRQARMAVLRVKETKLEEVFQRAQVRLAGLPDSDFDAWLKGLIVRNSVSGHEEVLPATADRSRFTGGLIKEINAELKKRGRAGALRLAGDDARVDRGCVLREGGLETNLSLESLMREAFLKAEDELVDLLFGEAK